MARPAQQPTTPDGDPVGPQLGDAFGALLLACWEAGAAPSEVWEFVERDDGFLGGGDAARYFAAPEAWGSLDTWACRQAQGRILDLGCGAGRHTLLLQQAGHDVVALDVSPGAIEVCRRRGVLQPLLGTVAELRLAAVAPFDTLLLLGNNLGLLQNAQQAPALLAALAAVAAPDARVIGQSQDPQATSNPVHLSYHHRNRGLGRMPGQIRMRVRHNNLATDWFDYLFASVAELEQLVAGSAWQIEQIEADGASYIAVLRHRAS